MVQSQLYLFLRTTHMLYIEMHFQLTEIVFFLLLIKPGWSSKVFFLCVTWSVSFIQMHKFCVELIHLAHYCCACIDELEYKMHDLHKVVWEMLVSSSASCHLFWSHHTCISLVKRQGFDFSLTLHFLWCKSGENTHNMKNNWKYIYMYTYIYSFI